MATHQSQQVDAQTAYACCIGTTDAASAPVVAAESDMALSQKASLRLLLQLRLIRIIRHLYVLDMAAEL